MSRFRDLDDDTNEDGIDISPLIDCVFILLIFFIVTATFVEEAGVDITAPLSTTKERLEKNSIYIAITRNGEVVYGGREIGVAGVQPLVKRMLMQDDQLPVVVQADTGAPTGVLVRIVDEAKLAGAIKVSMSSEKPSN